MIIGDYIGLPTEKIESHEAVLNIRFLTGIIFRGNKIQRILRI